jgi:hypothetical protein
VAFGSDAVSLQQIFLSGVVTLNSFQVAAYGTTATVEMAVIDAADNSVLFNSSETISTAQTFSGPWSSSVGIAIQLGN